MVTILIFTIVTKNEAQPPHKQKAETYRSTSGGVGEPPPPPHSNGELQKQQNNGHKQFLTRHTPNPTYNSTVNMSHCV